MNKTPIGLKGKFHLEHYRNGELLETQEFENAVTNIGLDTILDIMFSAGSQVTTWYLSLIDNAGSPTLAAADTMASHAGWSEFNNYDFSASSTNRGTWSESGVSSQAITNSTPVQFDITGAGGTVYGVFLTDTQSRSPGNTGTLWATAALGTPIAVVASDALKITYTITAAAA